MISFDVDTKIIPYYSMAFFVLSDCALRNRIMWPLRYVKGIALLRT